MATMDDLFKLNRKTQILISATIRNESTIAAFCEACRMFSHRQSMLPSSADITILGARAFSVERLHVELPTEPEQIGFFHPTKTIIHFYSITDTSNEEIRTISEETRAPS